MHAVILIKNTFFMHLGVDFLPVTAISIRVGLNVFQFFVDTV